MINWPWPHFSSEEFAKRLKFFQRLLNLFQFHLIKFGVALEETFSEDSGYGELAKLLCCFGNPDSGFLRSDDRVEDDGCKKGER